MFVQLKIRLSLLWCVFFGRVRAHTIVTVGGVLFGLACVGSVLVSRLGIGVGYAIWRGLYGLVI